MWLPRTLSRTLLAPLPLDTSKGGAASLPHPPGGVGHKRQVLRVAEERRRVVALTLMRSGPQGGEESRKVTWATQGETPQLVLQSWQI